MKLGTGEIILILAALLLLFGGKKIPELMKGLGKGMKEFKDASNGSPDANVNETTTTTTRVEKTDQK